MYTCDCATLLSWQSPIQLSGKHIIPTSPRHSMYGIFTHLHSAHLNNAILLGIFTLMFYLFHHICGNVKLSNQATLKIKKVRPNTCTFSEVVLFFFLVRSRLPLISLLDSCTAVVFLCVRWLWATLWSSASSLPQWSKAWGVLKMRLMHRVGNWASWKKGTWLFSVYLGDEMLPSYIGIIINHYKDPY